MAKNPGLSFSVVGDNKSFGRVLPKVKLDIKKPPTFKVKKIKLRKSRIRTLIATRPSLVGLSAFSNLGFQANLVGYNPKFDEASILKPLSPRLLNWVEPYEIDDEIKTLFYTEVNSGLKVGERVFIINGNYDSDLLIKKDKYKRGRDGYKVLFIDKCKVVLDIDYTGQIPISPELDDSYVGVYHIQTDDDFRWAEKSFTTKRGNFSRKFDYYNNNIVYANKNFGPFDVWGKQVSIQEAPGFFVRNTSDTFGLDKSLLIEEGFESEFGISEINSIYLGTSSIIVGGSFDKYNGSLVGKNIFSILYDGEIDINFTPGVGFNGPVNVIEILNPTTTGGPFSYLIGGSFSSYNGVTCQNLVKVNTSGDLDTTFKNNLNSLLNGPVKTICVFATSSSISDTRIAVGGDFTGGFKIINPNGTTFSTPPSLFNFDNNGLGSVNVIKFINSSIGFVVGGDFLTVNGLSARKLAIVNMTGVLNSTFNTNISTSGGFGDQVNDIAILSNLTNFAVIVGDFNTFNGQPIGGIAALNLSTGLTIDFSSGVGFNGDVKSIKRTPDDKLFIGGNFTEFNGNKIKNLARLNSNGTFDFTFQTGEGFSDNINVVSLTSSTSVFAGGKFEKYNVNNSKNLVKLGVVPWVNISYAFEVGSFSFASSTNSVSTKLKVYNSSFTYSINKEVVEFNEGEVYKWDMSEEPNAVRGSFSTWILDVTHNTPILTKTNFRGGEFNGTWNVGLFGRQNKKIKWKGKSSTFNTGTILNTIWEKGDIKSKFSLGQSFVTEFDQNGLPIQKLARPNNNGKGYNFIIDSLIKNSIIDNANIINSQLGESSATFSVVENNILSQKNTIPVEVKRGYFENTKLNNSSIRNSELRNIRSNNSTFDNVKSINSFFKKSYVKNSDFISDDIIKITGYDEFNISEYQINKTIPGVLTINTSGIPNSHKVYKFYIDKKFYEKLKLNDTFYIKGLRIINDNQNLINFFDKKFRIGSWNEYVDDYFDPSSDYFPNVPSGNSFNVNNDSFYKRPIDVVAFLSSPNDNSWVYNSTFITEPGPGIPTTLPPSLTQFFTIPNQNSITYSTTTISENPKKGYSIDIVVSTQDKDFNIVSGLDFDRNGTSTQIYSNETLLFNYYADELITEPVAPYGYYNGRPYYALTNKTPFASGYVFYSNGTESINSVSNRWEHHRFFSPVYGNTYDSDYYGFLTVTSSLPDSSTVSWQPGEFSDQSVSSSIPFNNNNNNNNIGTYSPKTISTKIGNIIDISNAYIVDSDFESGLFERSNWNSGNLISSNNDANITTPTVEGGFYNLDIITSSSTIIAKTLLNIDYREREESFFNIGDVLYLNSVNYDTTGKIASYSIVASGSFYEDGLSILIGTNSFGNTQSASANIIVGSSSEIVSLELENAGVGYKVNDELEILSGTGIGGKLKVLSITGSIVRLPDSYKITEIYGDILILKEIYATNSQLSNLLPDGLSYTKDSYNRYGYLHTVKFNRSYVKKGLLQRVYLNNNLIQNNQINLNDRDFLKISLFRNLIVSDILFINNRNILGKASYVRSNYINKTTSPNRDNWIDGLFYNSIWIDGVFLRGLVKSSTWYNGIFRSGTFYESRSFNGISNETYTQYDTDRIKNHWKSGYTSATVSNDRFSWRNGTFRSGEFVKSDWEAGQFLSGRFYNSKWYSGTFSSGVIGDDALSLFDTWFYNGQIKTAIVENANLYAIDTSYSGLSSSNILWETGIFNGGAFGCDILEQKTASHTAVWRTGTFNSGEFQTNGKWLNGVFNGGKFISGFGWTQSPSITEISSERSEYGWEDGDFNGGEFGTADRGTNSTWWSGEFKGGKFQGRIWNDGTFTEGIFIGSSTYSAVGGYDLDEFDDSNANQFMLSFTKDFWGIWKNGEVNSEMSKNKKIFSIRRRSVNLNIRRPNTLNFSNMLWLGGTFSNQSANFNNSLWLGGGFLRGNFIYSAFNPYVSKQGPNTTKSFNLNDDLKQVSGNCIWVDGRFIESDFYISQWLTGQFVSGTAFGMVWKNGTTQYMNAYNVFWENGIWKNGNWFGSFIQFDEDGAVTNSFHKELLLRGMNWNGTSSSHIWNIFESSTEILSSMGSRMANAISNPSNQNTSGFAAITFQNVNTQI
jgi:hypothetical protein